MAGSTFGTIFRITTWGESHGKGVGVTIDGCPAGLELSEEDVQKYLVLHPQFQKALHICLKLKVVFLFSFDRCCHLFYKNNKFHFVLNTVWFLYKAIVQDD